MKNINNILLFLVLIIFFFSAYFIIFNSDEYMLFLEKYLSRDGSIKKPNLIFMKIQGFLALLVVFVVLFNFYLKINLLPFKYLSKFDTVSIILILLVIASYSYSAINKTYMLHSEDSLFEILTACFAISASVLFLMSARNFKSLSTKYSIILLSVFSFLFGMEEISWGQRVFNWETSELWSSINYQNETNIHNLLNPVLREVSLLFNFLALVLFLARREIEKYLTILFPESDITMIVHKKESGYYALIFFFLLFQSYFFGGELTEEILSIILLSYALKYLSIKPLV